VHESTARKGTSILFILFQVLFYILFGRELETVFADSVLQNKKPFKRHGVMYISGCKGTTKIAHTQIIIE